MLDRLFAALGSQLRLYVEPLDAHIDAEMRRLAATPIDERIAQSGVDLVGANLDEARIPHIVEGAAAALLHGVPIPVAAVEVDIRWSDAEELTIGGRDTRSAHGRAAAPLPEPRGPVTAVTGELDHPG